MKKVLHVGCGQATLENLPRGFQNGEWEEVRLDISPGVNPDIIGTIQDMKSVAASSVDALYSSHNIEHVYKHEVPGVLSEFSRVLRPDGFCVIVCPDIEEVAKSIAKNGIDAPLYISASGPISPIDVIYGHSSSIENGAKYMAHKTGFGANTLTDLIISNGFTQIAGGRVKDLWELRYIARNSFGSEEELMQLFESYAL